MKLNPANTAIIRRLLVGRNNRPLRSILSKIEAADLASLVSLLNKRELQLFVEALLSIEKAAQTLIEVPEPQLIEALRRLTTDQILRTVADVGADDAAHFIGLLNPGEQTEIFARMPEEQAAKIRQYLSYPEDSAGRMMQAKVFYLSIDLTAKEALEILRKKAQTESIYYIYCVNERHQLAGIISLRQLAQPPNKNH